MKTTLICLALLLGSRLGLPAEEPQLVQTIPLPGVQGRIDHLSMDVAGQRLFIAALGNNTVEVVDLKQGKVLRSLSGFSEPQGVCFIPEFNLLTVASGGNGACTFYDGSTLKLLSTLPLGDDADNMRYDPLHKKLLVGYGSGAIAVIDPQTQRLALSIPLSNHPEAFQVDSSGSQLFVNVPNAHTVSVIDLAQNKVTGSLPLGLVAANFPMALDEAHHRLFVGCRIPSRLVVFDTRTGNKIATLTLHGDCDDLYYDTGRKQIYASCGEGYLDIFSQTDADHYVLKQSTPTSPGARTAFFDGTVLYLAVPRHENKPAELRLYHFAQ